jgi:hypothetical protein
MVVEVNANPYLERTSAFALAALQSGMGYTTMINRIVESAWSRFEPTPYLKELQKSRLERARMRKHTRQTVQPCETPLAKEIVKETNDKPALVKQPEI